MEILLSTLLAALPLSMAAYMWHSGDAQKERGVFWGCIALACVAAGSVWSETVFLLSAAIFVGIVVLLGIGAILASAIEGTRE